MLTVVQATAASWARVEPVFAPVHPTWVKPGEELPDADVYVLFDGPFTNLSNLNGTVFLQSVAGTNTDFPHPNLVRFNGWPGCLEGPVFEYCGQLSSTHEHWLNQLGKQPQAVPDVPGLVTPRVISLIINEAYFALGDGISTPEDIDTAMKLGTNYPFGPFEWAQAIGPAQVFHLLRELSLIHPRYAPAPALGLVVNL